VSVVICALNEEQSLPYVLSRIPNMVDEVVLVDGHSTDATIEVARLVRPDVKILVQAGRGKGDALRCGFEQATGEIIVTLDADGATNPEDMQRFVDPLVRGYEFAKGSRFSKGFPNNRHWHRILGNWLITATFNLLFFRRYTDLCSGYNAVWKKSVEKIRPWPVDGFENEPFINCMVVKRGLRVIEVAHSDSGRISGEVKELSWRQGPKAIKSILRERFRG
jgi:glycosyltransferase involved in cell wall biosynthesis